ncbi:MAG TPA: type 4a pilus biogenesis protein PilO [Candidatus Paceibacterota bacterium]|nr:type 4a pilus biogenesis protein PilO [Candidatus Paceibacterota bacterium]
MTRTIISLVLLVLAGSAFFLYTKPSYDTIQTLSAQGAQYDAALAKAAQLQSLKQTLLQRYNSFDPNQIARLTTMLPDQVDNIRLILDLDNIASKYGMALQNVNISTSDAASGSGPVGAVASNAQPFDSLTISFTTSGTYASFKQFMTDLQQSLRIVDLVSLTLSNPTGQVAAAGAPVDPQYTYTITLRTYWLR